MIKEKVSYKQVYDLVFRARNARLEPMVFTLEFTEWVKAGIAFNTRGFELPSRKISAFVEVYEAIQMCSFEDVEISTQSKNLFEQYLRYFYEDIFDIYQNYLKSTQSQMRLKGSKGIPVFADVFILPTYEGFPALKKMFPTSVESADTYKCINYQSFLHTINSIYLKPNTRLFNCMAMLYDYGSCKEKCGSLLEVSL